MTFLYILGIVFFVAFCVFCAWIKSPSVKGKVGELNVGKELQKLPSDYTVINDVILRTSRGTTQIDHVVVSRYGVFAIETKNYSGNIYGDDYRKQWTQIITTDVTFRKSWKTYTYVTKNRFYNPVKQSISHVMEIKKHLAKSPYVLVEPIVVFAGDAILTNVDSKYNIVYVENLVSTIQHYSQVYLTDEETAEVVLTIRLDNKRQEVDNKTHVKNIAAARSNRENKVKSGVCPNCGGKLVLRKGKYGQFYGCSNYPACRFTSKK